MERKLSLSSLQQAVDNAYEAYKSVHEGEVDARMEGVDAKGFGIAVMLTDGTLVKKGDTQVLAPMGRTALLPTHVLLLTQNKPEELVKKAGACGCQCNKSQKPKDMGLSAHGLRAVSVVEPQNDADGKWDLMVNNIINLVGSAPVLNDKLYEKMKADNAAANVLGAIADAQFSMYDKPEIAVDLWTRLAALQLNAEQFAAMGATIAADGRNPLNGQYAFDGAIAANVVATLGRGVHKAGRAWMMTVGLPATNSFGGMILAVLPGFGAIAAYSPELCGNGVSIKARKAIKDIANALQLNIYASARVEVVK